MTRLTTDYGFETTALEVVNGVDLTGKRAIVTGSSSGIGVETVRALAKAGAEITLAVRNTEAGKKVAREISADTGNQKLNVGKIDLLDQDSIRTFTDRWDGPLHILVNNAGIMSIPELQKTEEGWEKQFATNHLGHFALALGLHDALVAAGSARVVSVSSSGHQLSPVVFDDINYNFREYDPREAYGQSKTANILFVLGAAERWKEDGIMANALHPGVILTTNLQRFVEEEFQIAEDQVKTAQQGAATSVLLATSPVLEGITGRYFEDCNESFPVSERIDDRHYGLAPYAASSTNADRLWELSLQMVNPHI